MALDVKGMFGGIVEDFKSGDVKGILNQYGDIVLALVVVMIVGMMIIPLPTFLLDILLTLNITMAVVLLLVSIYIPDAPSWPPSPPSCSSPRCSGWRSTSPPPA